MPDQRESPGEEAEVHTELLNGINYTGNKGPCCGTRYSIIIMMALGSCIAFSTKTVFSIVIVAMTNSNTSSNANIPTYDWANKGLIISSVMWLGIPIQLISGHWGKQYGHKWFILGSVLANGILFMLIPLFAIIGGSIGVIVCRVIEGGLLGILTPISVGVSGLWVPAEERSKAGMIGAGVMFMGTTIAFVGAGQVVASSWGYPGCCYIVGSLSMFWCIAWYFLGHQSPATHPRITPEERDYIETSLNSRETQHIPTPWVKLLTSIHFWAPIVAAVGASWIDTMMSTVNIIYVTKAWDIDVAKSTSTIGIAPIVGLLFGIFLAPLSDFLIRKKYLRIVNARRIFHTVGIIGTAITLLWMTWIPPGSLALIILNLCIGNVFTIAFNVNGAGLNILDIAPAFAGIISGFASTFSQCFSLFAPMTIDWILTDERDQSQWRIIFYITAAIVTVTAIFFDVFAVDKGNWEDADEDNVNE